MKQYSRKLSIIFKFFEENIPNFLVDKLILPLENNTHFPPLDSYLDKSRTVGDKATSIKTYRYLGLLVLDLLGQQYGAGDADYEERIYDYKSGVELKVGRMTKMLAGLNRN